MLNPHQKNKVDITKLSEDEQRLFRLYGKLPNKKDLLQNKLKERKYFDSGDYALSKAGKASDTGVTTIGTEHPRADDIPHSMHPLTNTLSRGDSISSASPPSTSPAATAAGLSEGGQSISNGPSPAGMHRGSINGIPGGGLSNVQSMSRSPNKEQSALAKSASAEDHRMQEQVDEAQENVGSDMIDGVISPSAQTEGIPIRR